MIPNLKGIAYIDIWHAEEIEFMFPAGIYIEGGVT